ncbi:MAG: hypothetical protein ABSH26_17040 [Opitutaceae bacterium]|jgi:hypothetical protein
MKTLLVAIAGLATAGAALAQVDTTRPMVTGHGNVAARPQKVIVTNQTPTASQVAATSSDQTLTLEKFVVTGSLIQRPAKAAKNR